jgi:16S rRNA (cytosine1402-N4)-methyltransferase
MEIIHVPVMLKEVLHYLHITPNNIVVDCTVGEGGHSVEILKLLGKKGLLIGIDKDEYVLKKAHARLSEIADNFVLVHDSFANIKGVLDSLKISSVDAVLADLGVSSLQLYYPERGFSFMKDGPLDMRMDKSNNITAEVLVNGLGENELADVIYYYGEERLSRKIAHAIVEYRRKKRIKTTSELATIINSVYGARGRINPATKTFQALRIAVNDELKDLEKFLEDVPSVLKEGGRVAVISYHSLEDRLVKHAFSKNVYLKRINKKVIVPSIEEIRQNPRARSAKMRVAEKI